MNYKVGDMVTIREWDDMAGEFGSVSDDDISGSINTHPHFVPSMKELCGKTAEIFEIRDGKFRIIKLKFPQDSSYSPWNFSEQMFVGYVNEEMKRLEAHAEESDIEGFLLSI